MVDEGMHCHNQHWTQKNAFPDFKMVDLCLIQSQLYISPSSFLNCQLEFLFYLVRRQFFNVFSFVLGKMVLIPKRYWDQADCLSIDPLTSCGLFFAD